jgi:hypothetical protein
MASSLEIAKLVIASLLYQYWDTINKGLRAYLTVAAGVLNFNYFSWVFMVFYLLLIKKQQIKKVICNCNKLLL